MSKCDKCDYPNPECQKCVEELHAEYTCFKNDTEQRLAKAERLLNAADEENKKLRIVWKNTLVDTHVAYVGKHEICRMSRVDYGCEYWVVRIDLPGLRDFPHPPTTNLERATAWAEELIVRWFREARGE